MMVKFLKNKNKKSRSKELDRVIKLESMSFMNDILIETFLYNNKNLSTETIAEIFEKVVENYRSFDSILDETFYVKMYGFITMLINNNHNADKSIGIKEQMLSEIAKATARYYRSDIFKGLNDRQVFKTLCKIDSMKLKVI